MPSKFRSSASTERYPDQMKRMLATKNAPTIKALVRGIRRPLRARQYIRAEIELADEEDRPPRRELIGLLNRRVSDLTEDDD